MAFRKEIIEQYSDVTICLIDKNDRTEMKCNRVILANSSDYFDRLFRFNTDKIFFEMFVSNAKVMRLLILSFYNIEEETDLPQWLFELETIKCLDYLCMEIRPNRLYELKIPSEAFELFVEVACMFEIDFSLKKIINDNIPDGYDQSQFSLELFELLNTQTKIIVCSEIVDHYVTYKYKYIDYDTGSILKEDIVKSNTCYGGKFIVSKDHLEITCIHEERHIGKNILYKPGFKFYKTPSYTKIKQISEIIINGDHHIISICEMGRIQIWNYRTNLLYAALKVESALFEKIVSWKILNDIYIFVIFVSGRIIKWNIAKDNFSTYDYNCLNMTITNSNNKLITVYNVHSTNQFNLRIKNLCNDELLFEVELPMVSGHKMINMEITSDDKNIIMNSGNSIIIFNMEEMGTPRIIWIPSITSFSITPDNKQIVCVTSRHILIVDIDSAKIIKRFNLEHEAINAAIMYI